MIKEEFYRAFINISFLLAIALALVLIVFGLEQYTSPAGILLERHNAPWLHPANYNAYDAVIWVLGQPLSLLVPLIAILPFATSHVNDRNSGHLSHILVRTSYRRYFSAKFIANFLAGGAAVALPLILTFIFANVVYYRGIPPLEHSRIANGPWGAFSWLYRANPDLYIFALIAKSFFFGSCYATLGMAITLLVNNSYIALTTPFLLYVIGEFILEALGIPMWGPLATFSPLMNFLTNDLIVFTELSGILIISLLCMLLFARQERVYQ